MYFYVNIDMNMPKQMKTNGSKKEIKNSKSVQSTLEGNCNIKLVIQNICKDCKKEVIKCSCENKKKIKTKSFSFNLKIEMRKIFPMRID